MALFDFQSVPGLGTARETAERVFLWGKHEVAVYRSIVVDKGTTDVNNATSQYELRPGLLLAQASGGKWVNYLPTATDGTDVVWGVLATGLKMLNLDGNTADRVAFAVVAGPVKASQLIKNVASSPTIDPQGRVGMAGRFIFDDVLVDNPFPFLHNVAKTGDYTVLTSDVNSIFTTTGAGASVTFTLPSLLDAAGNPQMKGAQFKFVNSATPEQTMKVQTATADNTKLVTINNAGASSIAFSSAGHKIGAVVTVYASEAGTKWLSEIGTIDEGNVTVA